MFDKLIEKVKAEPKTIVFTEGSDARIQEAAARLLAEGLMGVVLVGNVEEVKKAAEEKGFDISKAEIIDPEAYDGMDEMVAKMVELRKGKMTEEECAAALKKGEMMYRGSFSVADPDGNIARWLDTNPNLYQRTSTHAKPYQGYYVDGHLNMPRGFDVREGMGGLLNGMRTFHYFTLPDVNHLHDGNQGSGPGRRLFFKCETYGIYFSTIHAKRTAKAASRTEEMRTRWYEFGDVCESIAHCASLLVSKVTSKTKAGIRKEDLPTPVGAAMMEAQAALLARGADRCFPYAHGRRGAGRRRHPAVPCP